MDALEIACQILLSSLGRLAQGEISAPQCTALDALRREIEPQAAVQDPLDLADHEEALASWLSSHGIVCEWVIAPPLGWHQWPTPSAPLPGVVLRMGRWW